jgi:ABC-2 type transport system permease protein
LKLVPGSAPWLLRHELRLAWRGTGTRRLWFLTGIGAVLWLLYHLAAWGMLEDAQALPPGLFVMIGVGTWFVFTLILAQAINLSVGAFFERGDLDLLLASPLPPRSVFLVRGLGVAIAAVALYAWLITPFANVGAATGQPRLLAIYPALAAMALLAAAIGMASTVALVRLLGARRARTVAQLLGAFVGAAIFLVLQFNNLVAPERSQRWRAALSRLAAEGGPLDRDSLVWLPLNAMRGQPVALLVLAVAGAGAFAWVVARLAKRFAAGTQESMTTPRRAPAAAAAASGSVRFRAGLWHTVLVKEWKLIARDPQLIAHTLLQSLYMLPVAFVWLRGESAQVVLAPTLVLLAATLASGLVWLTVAAEDAPELLASAPVERGRLRRAKLVAGLAPVAAIMLPLAFVLALADIGAAAIFSVCVLGATISAGAIHLLLPRPGRRRDLRRRGKNDLLAGVLEFIASISWAGLTWCLLTAPFYAPLPALAALGAPLAAWSLGRGRRRQLEAA